MGKIIAFANCKGGSGKTVSTFLVGRYLAAEEKSALFIDLDWQAGLKRLYDVHANNKEKMNIFTAGDWYKGFENEPESGKRIEKLRMVLEPLREQYDYILLDCPPIPRSLVDTVLSVADELIIPTRVSQTDIIILDNFLKQVEDIKQRENQSLNILGYIAVAPEEKPLGTLKEKYKLLARIDFDDNHVPSITSTL